MDPYTCNKYWIKSINMMGIFLATPRGRHLPPVSSESQRWCQRSPRGWPEVEGALAPWGVRGWPREKDTPEYLQMLVKRAAPGLALRGCLGASGAEQGAKGFPERNRQGQLRRVRGG